MILNILGGMDTATTGSVMVSGKNITNFNSKQLTAYRRHDVVNEKIDFERGYEPGANSSFRR